MLNYSSIKNHPITFQDVTGLTPAAFAGLLPAFKQAYEAASLAKESQRKTPRQRQRGGGRKATLATNADKLVFILFYFRFYPTQQLLGLLFGLSQTQANYWGRYLTPILNQALGYENRLPACNTTNLEQVFAACPGLKIIFEGIA